MDYQENRQSLNNNHGKTGRNDGQILNQGLSGQQSSVMATVQQAELEPYLLTKADIMQLHKSIGNQAVVQLLGDVNQRRTEPSKDLEVIQGLESIHDPGSSNTSGNTAQLYRVGYMPRLARAPRPANGIAYSHDTFARPANFDDETIQQVYHDAPQQVAQNPISHKTEVYYQCASCLNWFPYEAMQIGHIETWADYIAEKAPADTAEARDAYNDLDNLQLQCSTCNQGHAFEEDMGDDDDDSSDDFIDDSQMDPEEDKKAFDELRTNILPGLRGQKL